MSNVRLRAACSARSSFERLVRSSSERRGRAARAEGLRCPEITMR